MHNPWVLTAGMAVIAVGTVGGTYLATTGYANRSTVTGDVNRSDKFDATAASPRPTVTATATGTPGPVRTYAQAPAVTIDPTKQYTATIKTSKGDVVVQLFANDAPKTVNSFVYLAQHHFYDGLNFHRVVPGFVIQGGDPKGDGTGGPGYQLPDEINSHKNDAGTLAMANAGPGTDGSQFFIDLTPQPNLDGKYTVFGQVTSGLDVVQAIGSTPRDPRSVNAPAVTIDSITVNAQ
ncbi:MAG: peptidylprolyl isomerase [Dehalococcoidia bacterium]